MQYFSYPANRSLHPVSQPADTECLPEAPGIKTTYLLRAFDVAFRGLL